MLATSYIAHNPNGNNQTTAPSPGMFKVDILSTKDCELNRSLFANANNSANNFVENSISCWYYFKWYYSPTAETKQDNVNNGLEIGKLTSIGGCDGVLVQSIGGSGLTFYFTKDNVSLYDYWGCSTVY